MGLDKSIKLEETTARAVEAIEKYAEDEKTFFESPKEMFEDLVRIRKDIKDAWREAKAEIDENTVRETAEIPEPADFRSSYVEMMTDAFAEPLEEMRLQQEPAGANDVDVNILVECMQSGIDLLTPEEKQFFLDELEVTEIDAKENDGEPYHTVRRRELGYDVKMPEP